MFLKNTSSTCPRGEFRYRHKRGWNEIVPEIAHLKLVDFALDATEIPRARLPIERKDEAQIVRFEASRKHAAARELAGPCTSKKKFEIGQLETPPYT
eukprot:4719151-Pleurochrysis_carterae.AAC.1